MDSIWSDKRLLAADGAASALHTNRRNEQFTSSANTNSIRKTVENHNLKCCARINKGICRRRHQRSSMDMAADATTHLDNSECSGTNYKFECDSVYMTKNDTTLNNNNNNENAITYNSYHKYINNNYIHINADDAKNNVNYTKQISDDEHNWQNRKNIDFCVTSTTNGIAARIKQFVKHAKQKRTLCEQWVAIVCYLLLISSITVCEAHKYDGECTQLLYIYTQILLLFNFPVPTFRCTSK